MLTDDAEEYPSLPLRVYVFGGLMVVVGLVTFAVMLLDPHANGRDVLFLYSIAANVAITVFPIEPILVYCGQYSGPIGVAMVALAGTLLATYLDHRVFVPVLNHRRVVRHKESSLYRSLSRPFGKNPFAIVTLVALSPLPLWPAKLLTFSMRYPLGRYIAAVTVGRLPKYFLLAWLGTAVSIPDWLLVGLMLAVFAVYGVQLGWDERRRAVRASTGGSTPARVRGTAANIDMEEG